MKKLATICFLLMGLSVAFGGQGRTELSQADFATGTYTINVAGSYVLTENIDLTGATHDGISVRADDVTIDLNGFGIYGPGTAGDYGIVAHLLLGIRSICVRNGTVAGWGSSVGCGVYLGARNSRIDGVTAHNNNAGIFAVNAVVSDCVTYSNVAGGIQVAGGSIVRDCTAIENEYAGILVGSGSIAMRCAAVSNGAYGIVASVDSIISDCTAYWHATNGIRAETGSMVLNSTVEDAGYAGIFLDIYSMAAGCAATDGTRHGIQAEGVSSVRSSTASDNLYAGIKVEAGGLISDCVSFENGQDGIQVDYGETRIVGNQCADNGYAGIWLPSTCERAQIQNNNLVSNQRGLEMDSGSVSNIIIKNSASGNSSVDYDLSGGVNTVGPLTSDESNTYECANFDL